MRDRPVQSRKLLTGCLVLASLGVVLVACGSDEYLDIPLQDLEGTSPTDEGNGRPKKKDPAEDEGGGEDENGDWEYKDKNGTPLPAEGECANAPTLPNTSAGFWCDFLDKGKGGLCQADETCCNPGVTGVAGKFATSFCAKTPQSGKGAYPSAACKALAPADEFGWIEKGSTTWECADRSGCSEGQECCLGSLSTDQGLTVNIGPWKKDEPYGVPASCKALQAYKNSGTHCAAKCERPEIKLCSADDQCKTGQKCIPFHAFNRKSFGYCK